MPREDRERVLVRIEELRDVLRETQAEDLRRTLEQAIAECTRRLAELDAQLGIDS